MQKVNEIAKLHWLHEDASEETKHQRVVRALSYMKSWSLLMEQKACG